MSIYLKGLIHFYRNNLDEAVAHFQQALDNKYILHSRASLDSFVGLALAYQARGLSELAGETIQELVDYVTPMEDPASMTIANLAPKRLSILQGLPARWHRQVPSAAENMVWWLENQTLTHCRILLAEGTKQGLEKAMNQLQELLQQNQNIHNTCQLIQILPLLAMVFKKQDRGDEALKALTQSVKLAEQGGWIWPFLEFGQPMKESLQKLQEQKISINFVERLLAAYQDASQKTGSTSPRQNTHAAPQPVSSNIEKSMTSREKEILELLVQGKANKEIAETLFVSIDTVKTHLKNVFHKLEVNSRLQAVAKVNDLGLNIKKDSRE